MSSPSTPLMIEDRLFIAGKLRPASGGGTFDNINPATEEVYGRISIGSAADVDRAVAAASRAFETFSATSRDERIELLQAVLDVFVRRADEVTAICPSRTGCRCHGYR